MESKEIARQRIISFIEDVYESYKEFEEELNLKPATVTEWKRGRSNTFMNMLPEIADALATSTDYLLGFDKSSPDFFDVPIIGRIRAGYPIESYPNRLGTIKIPCEVIPQSDDIFALEVVGDSMMPVVMEGDIIICDKRTDQANGKICAVTIDGESTLKRIRIDSQGVTLIPTNPMYKELHYTPKKAEEKGFRIDGVLVQMIRNF